MVLSLEQKLKQAITAVKNDDVLFNSTQPFDNQGSENQLCQWCSASAYGFFSKPSQIVNENRLLNTSSPSGLSADYVFIETTRMKSRVYTTDKPKPFCFFFKFKTQDSNHTSDWDICYLKHSQLGNTFGGNGASEIKISLVRNCFTYASKIGADLIVMDLIRNSPFNLDINPVEGLGRYNFQGEVNANFYRLKKR